MPSACQIGYVIGMLYALIGLLVCIITMVKFVDHGNDVASVVGVIAGLLWPLTVLVWLIKGDLLRR
ncbi:hypothetical protein [Halorhodospira abdelmalekii]|uniref:hypothetical protein n=1 Tax=Halorhodospira abdelmalekii TaxID=421629 RepID=UPI001907B72A|nr:hypothetical protein [Halorhodospira abdelmalekii]